SFAQAAPPPPPSPQPSPSSGNGRGPTVSTHTAIPTNGQGGAQTGPTGTTARHSYPHGNQPKGTKVAEFIYRDLKSAPYLRVDKYVTAQGDKSFPQYRLRTDSGSNAERTGPRYHSVCPNCWQRHRAQP